MAWMKNIVLDLDSLSLPPAEGAEQRIRVRNILQDFYRRGESPRFLEKALIRG